MRSKRQRKLKDRNSLKRKRQGSADETSEPGAAAVDPGAAPDGLEQGKEVELDSNAAILPARAPKAEAEEKAAPRKISKGEQRKLKQIAREKATKAQREQVYATIEKNALSETEFSLLKRSTAVGQRETKRQKVSRELVMQRAGLTLPKDAQLERRRVVSQMPARESNPLQSCQAGGTPAAQATPQGSDLGSEGSGRSGGGAKEMEAGEESAEREAAVQPPQDPALLRQAVEAARAEFGLPTPSGAPPEGSAAGAPQRPSEASGSARLVQVERGEKVEAARAELPILGMEQEVMEAVLEQDVVVLSGETGCGKTTQVPQFLYEAGYGCKLYADRSGMIGVSQPRRVAAIASAQRVAAEMDTCIGDVVGYQVRYDKKVADESAIKFMTDGILLREAQSDFLLRSYSCLIIDEAHERSLNTDLLIGMLSRIVPLRRKMAAEGKGPPLKLVIMSATLRTQDFVGNARLFPVPPPLVNVPARQYPVTLHFSRQTEMHDYAGAVFAKVSQIHRQLPPGGILVFMTGQREVESLCKRLRTSLGKSRKEGGPHADPHERHGAGAVEEGGMEDGFGEDAAEAADDVREDKLGDSVEGGTDDYDVDYLSEEEETLQLGGEGFTPQQLAEAEKRFQDQLGVAVAPEAAVVKEEGGPVHVLPLYATLSRSAQDRVFAALPAGHRLIVVATNVAETSLTIPGIRYVVDSGRSKQKLLEVSSGMARYEVGWISKASSLQRAGRAGRTGPGHCYRLFSSAVFNDTFIEHTPPEILNTALEGVVLVMKAMGIEKVTNFPYPTPPLPLGLKEAIRCLEALGAMDPSSGNLTPLGRDMATLPVSPRHSRLILQVAGDAKRRSSVLPYAVQLAAASSVESPFVHLDSLQGEGADATGREQQSARAAHNRLRSSHSDPLSAMNALIAYQAAPNPAQFCSSHRLHSRNLVEMVALQAQLRRIVARKFPEVDLDVPLQQDPGTLTAMTLKKALAAGWADQVARRVRGADHVAKGMEPGGKKRAVRYQCGLGQEEVFLHPHSALYKAAPEFVIYSQLIRSAKRPYMAGISEIEPHWLVDAAAPLCSLSAPLEDPPPQYVAKHDAVMAWQGVTFALHSWQLPRTRVVHPDPAVRARCFAVALLDGSVLPTMAGLKQKLVAPASTAAKPEAQGLPRVGLLASALRSGGLDGRAKLRAAWKRNPGLLKKELGGWMKKGETAALQAVWPLLLAECQGKAPKHGGRK